MNATALAKLFPCACLAWGTLTLTAQETAITYQGRLASGPNPAQGSYDLRFSVHDALAGGNRVGVSITNMTTSVSGGLFIVDLDFGPGVFTGGPRWLEIGVRTNGAESFTTLSPRQRLAPTPYALYAPVAGNAISAKAVAVGAVETSGLQDSAVNSSKIADQTIADVDLSAVLRDETFWRLDGNGGTTAGLSFLGTTDKEPLEFKVNGQRALRLEPTTNSPNLIGGFAGNYVGPDIVGATISGGGTSGEVNSMDVYIVRPDEGGPFSVIPAFGTIGGGSSNRIENGSHGTIAGGWRNSIAGWSRYFDSSENNSIGGGSDNRIGGSVASTISGGQSNRIAGGDNMGVSHSTIGGGWNNWIDGGFDPVSGATIAGGIDNWIEVGANDSTVGGGFNNFIGPWSTGGTVAGGSDNGVSIEADYSTIGGGYSNACVNRFAVISGGSGHWASVEYASIGGGYSNQVSINAVHGTIPGGAQALARSYSQFAYAAGHFQDRGDAQTSIYVCRRTTTNATPTELRLDGALERMEIPDNATWSFDILVTGRTASGTSAGYQIRGAVARNAGTTSFIGSPSVTVLGEDVGSWSAGVVADDLNDALTVAVTGAADTTIRWVASVRTVEVIF